MVLSSCCGVGSLRTGTLIIGALNLVLALLVLPLAGWCASDPSGVAKLYLDQTKPGWRNEVSATYQRLQASTGPHFNTESEKDIEAAIVDAVASWTFFYGVALLIGSILSTVKSALLIHGARKQAKLEQEVKENEGHLEASRELREELEGRLDELRSLSNAKHLKVEQELVEKKAELEVVVARLEAQGEQLQDTQEKLQEMEEEMEKEGELW